MSAAAEAIERLAAELDIDIDTVAATSPRMARTHTDRSESVREIQRLAGIPPRSESLSDSVRVDDVEFEDTIRHEAAHAAAATALGWWVTRVDARAGETVTVPPDYQWQSVSARQLQEAVIAASAQAFTGSYRNQPFEDDRFQVRRRGRVDWVTAREKAEKLAADRKVKAMYNRLVDALRMVGGVLEGDALLAVFEGE